MVIRRWETFDILARHDKLKAYTDKLEAYTDKLKAYLMSYLRPNFD